MFYENKFQNELSISSLVVENRKIKPCSEKIDTKIMFLGKINDELIFKSVMNYWEKIFDIVVVL